MIFFLTKNKNVQQENQRKLLFPFGGAERTVISDDGRTPDGSVRADSSQGRGSGYVLWVHVLTAACFLTGLQHEKSSREILIAFLLLVKKNLNFCVCERMRT